MIDERFYRNRRVTRTHVPAFIENGYAYADERMDAWFCSTGLGGKSKKNTAGGRCEEGHLQYLGSENDDEKSGYPT